MRAAPGIKVLATSRAALRVSGEVEYQVAPLQLPDPADLPAVEVLETMEAIRLFVDRARAARADFRLDPANAAAVADIVARLDGLPLAIELAAARVKVLPPKAILDRLSSTLDLLTAGSRDLPSRQQSLRAAIQWSYDLLDEGDRALLRRLGVFVRGAPLEAIEDVCSGGAVTDVFDALQSLVEHSLVRTVDEGESNRFHLLETIRVFALDMLRTEGEEESVRRDHFGHYSALAASAAAHVLASSSPMWLDRLETENDNLRAALNWALQMGNSVGASNMVGNLWRFWQRRGHVAEGREKVAAVLALPAADPAARFAALEAAGGLAYWQADLPTAIEAYEEQEQLAREMGDDGLLIDALFNLRITQYIADIDGARTRGAVQELFDEANALAEKLGDPARLASVNWGIGTALAQGGRPGAVEYLDRALAGYGATGNDFMVGWSRRMRSIALITEGEGDEARDDLRAALDIFLAAGDLSAVTAIVQDYAALALAEHRYDVTLRLVGAVSALAMESETSIIDFTANRLPDLNHAIEAVGEERADKLVAEGRAWSLPELIEILR
jgi:predicted ATPase